MMLMAASLRAPMVSSLIQTVASSFINVISEKIAMTARKGQDGGFIPLLTLALMIEVLEKGATKAGKIYNNMDHMDKKIFRFTPPFKAISRLLGISVTNLDLMVFFQEIVYLNKQWSVCQKSEKQTK